MKRTIILAAAVATLILLPAATMAGPVFFAGRLVDGKFIPHKDVKAPFYTVRYSTITATIDEKAAKVEIHETYTGPEKAIDVVCLIPLPKSVIFRSNTSVPIKASNLGEDFKPLMGQLLTPKEAQKVYEAIAKETGSVEILSLTGRPAMLVEHKLTLNKAEMRFWFKQEITKVQGIRFFDCPMPAAEFARGPVAKLSLTAGIKTKKPLRTIFSPTHEAVIERKGLGEAVVRVKADNFSGGGDFRLYYVADEDALGLRVLTHRGEGDEDGYFMLIGNPTGGGRGEKVVAKDVIFVLDTSGSMRGEKIEQARAAIDYCLGRLNPSDRFNIVTFGTDVKRFGSGLTSVSKANISAGREFVENLVARGRTNISGALAAALGGKPTKGRPRIMIFLTDGTPTIGELVPEKIIEAVKEANTSAARVFVMGVGHDVNAHLLDRLAEMTDGSSEYLDPDEEIDVKVAVLYDRLSYPVLTDVAVGFGKLRTHSVYPKKLPVLFKGSEIMVFGRYSDGGTHTFTISGALAGKKVEYACKALFPDTPAAADRQFLAPLWAARKIGFLLQEIRLHGENKELIEEVVRLSKKFGVVTEYTEFLALAGGDMTDEVVLRKAAENMRRANANLEGQWAVQQARNDARLQNRVVAANAANCYVDRRGRVVAAARIRQVGRRAFYLRDGQWVDADEAGERKIRTVELFSKEYFKLLRANKDFAQAQKIGWNVSMNIGDERIVVEKDGKTKIDTLRDKKDKTGPNSQNNNDRQIPRVQNRQQNRANPNDKTEKNEEKRQ